MSKSIIARNVFHLSARTVIKPYLICFEKTDTATVESPAFSPTDDIDDHNTRALGNKEARVSRVNPSLGQRQAHEQDTHILPLCLCFCLSLSAFFAHWTSSTISQQCVLYIYPTWSITTVPDLRPIWSRILKQYILHILNLVHLRLHPMYARPGVES